MNRISRFEIKGFKSIQSAAIEAEAINIFIGANGSGKSNLIAFFRMLSWMIKSVDRFQEHIGNLGFASSVLFDGPAVTREVEGLVEMETERGYNEYAFRLARSGQDQLFFAEEKVRFSAREFPGRADRWTDLGFGHTQSQLPFKISSNNTVKVVAALLKSIFIYQFHNTAPDAPIRSAWSVADGRYLKENAGNLGSFLYHLEQNDSAHYVRIVQYLQTVLPFFDNFELYPDRGQILLRWREKGSDQVFFAGQASDGMLRMIALIALLAQPPQDLPAVIFIDEPELGLHPAAIGLLAGLLKKASQHSQLFVATQSASLLDSFEPDNIIVIERIGRPSTFKRLQAEPLQSWLEDYSLGELWEKNVLGGRP